MLQTLPANHAGASGQARRRIAGNAGDGRRLHTPRVSEVGTQADGGPCVATVEVTTENFDSVVMTPTSPWWISGRPGVARAGCSGRSSNALRKHADLVPPGSTPRRSELAQAFGITSIPTLMVIRDQVILREAGALPEGSLEQLIGQAREVDMAEVKAGISAKQTEEAKVESQKESKC
jgi:thioredoxin 1